MTVLRVVVAGLGSVDRRDDGAGAAVALRAAEDLDGAVGVGPLGEPLDLIGLWDEADLAVVVDAVRTGAPPGTLHWIELDTETTLPLGGSSTHGLGLQGALRLARAIGRAPARVAVLGIEGSDFSFGGTLTPAVEAALPEAVRQVTELVKQAASCA